ncbi:DUF4097 family beta strand repeat-containing protein [Amycolatopsis azurea]|uniref:Lipoprotein n=1 Tax=Amycolatopsis azurea DSM 43854 TaxID=1238180 RepID=M2QHB6_9PSEU|nr:DUF4097 family beta strand repeat-containing protein [Amycolatopsis azurea]EMD25372.1 lipoprotein [Amycolatopsis azurea DSM 43854]OOC03998.1 hypothetical protein B0293_23960 [Amycolatopsis azurea DSM 43854]
MARPLLAFGGIALIGVGVLTGLGWWWPSDAEATSELTQSIKNVRVDNEDGAVKIRTGSGPVKVHQAFEYRWNKPGDAYRVEGDTLVLAGCGNNCEVAYDVIVPAGIPVSGKVDSGAVEIAGVSTVDITVDSGRVEVSDVPGTVKVRADSGRVELKNIGQDVDVHASSGAIKGERLGGNVKTQADSGRIDLELVKAANVTAKSDSGSIEVTVPSGDYDVTGTTDSGRRDIDVNQSGSAQYKLDLTTDSGSVKVKAA